MRIPLNACRVCACTCPRPAFSRRSNSNLISSYLRPNEPLVRVVEVKLGERMKIAVWRLACLPLDAIRKNKKKHRTRLCHGVRGMGAQPDASRIDQLNSKFRLLDKEKKKQTLARSRNGATFAARMRAVYHLRESNSGVYLQRGRGMVSQGSHLYPRRNDTSSARRPV